MSTTQPSAGELAAALEQSRLLAANALIFVGEAGKIFEQMREFWQHGTSVAAGSLLAQEFAAWQKRVMEGPMPVLAKVGEAKAETV